MERALFGRGATNLTFVQVSLIRVLLKRLLSLDPPTAAPPPLGLVPLRHARLLVDVVRLSFRVVGVEGFPVAPLRGSAAGHSRDRWLLHARAERGHL